MRSIEMTFDAATEARLRDDWARLAEAGLPSLALHTAASNRPHVTLVAGADLAVPTGVPALPAAIDFAGLLLFPHGDRFVLAWSVVRSRELDELQRSVWHPDALPTSQPDAWTPHVTLSRRLSADQVAAALPLLGAPFAGAATGVRFWDGETKTLTAIPSSTGPDHP
ncbi:2'-5' RNA ligase family protein [Microbacteriaceae bacterium VKM Ac-2854]|nr:2'-5' RNA ligase family protein [Microbacteriaceae bacterium VKM Ac-2854]